MRVNVCFWGRGGAPGERRLRGRHALTPRWTTATGDRSALLAPPPLSRRLPLPPHHPPRTSFSPPPPSSLGPCVSTSPAHLYIFGSTDAVCRPLTRSRTRGMGRIEPSTSVGGFVIRYRSAGSDFGTYTVFREWLSLHSYK